MHLIHFRDMDDIFVKRLHKFYQKNEQGTSYPNSELKKMFSPYRTPTQKSKNNIFLSTLIGMRRNKSKC